VIHDNGSTFQPTIDYLNELESSGLKVYRIKKEKYKLKHDLYNKVNLSIKDYFKNSDSPYYCVTDPDIAFYENTPGNILESYASFLETFDKVIKVGPMLKTNDIPDYYPLKERVIETYKKRQYSKEKIEINFKENLFNVCVATLTAFGMYKRNTIFIKKALSYRFDEPYDAKHLDWYIDFKNMTEDQIYYMNTERSADNMAHWGAEYLLELKKRRK
jgi:hypothetical protein